MYMLFRTWRSSIPVCDGAPSTGIIVAVAEMMTAAEKSFILFSDATEDRSCLTLYLSKHANIRVKLVTPGETRVVWAWRWRVSSRAPAFDRAALAGNNVGYFSVGVVVGLVTVGFGYESQLTAIPYQSERAIIMSRPGHSSILSRSFSAK